MPMRSRCALLCKNWRSLRWWASAKGGPVDPAERWKAALEALQEDANAKLPR
jgi:hypothetical protein